MAHSLPRTARHDPPHVPGILSMNAKALILSLPLVATLLTSCLISVDSHTQHTGRRISEQTLSQIEPGRKDDYVVAVLGEPTRKTKLAEGNEIWKWEYREKRVQSGTLIFVFSKDETTVTEGAVYVELKDGVVVRTWRD